MFNKLVEAIKLAEEKEFNENSYDYMLDESFFDDEIAEFLLEGEEGKKADLVREAERLAKIAVGKFGKELKHAKECDSVFDDSIGVERGNGSVQVLAIGCQSIDSKPGKFEFQNAREIDAFVDGKLIPQMKKIVEELQGKTEHKLQLSTSGSTIRIMLVAGSLNESEYSEFDDEIYDFMNEEKCEELEDLEPKKEEKCKDKEDCDEDDEEDEKEKDSDDDEEESDDKKEEKDDEDNDKEDDDEEESDDKKEEKDDEDDDDKEDDEEEDDKEKSSKEKIEESSILYEGKKVHLPKMTNDEIDDDNDTDECFEELLEFCAEI